MGLNFFSVSRDSEDMARMAPVSRGKRLRDELLKGVEAGIARAVGVVLPNPRNFTITRCLEIGVGGDLLLAEVHYLGCTNFEGRKILLYRGVSRYTLERQTVIDPHFSEGERYVHPIARIVPTDEGWAMGVKLATELAGGNKS